MNPLSLAPKIDRDRWVAFAELLAILLVVSLPWSTSATGILAGLWLISLIPVLRPAELRSVLATPAGALPVLLWIAGVVGMLWASDATFAERIEGLGSFHKLLVIPLLMAQFQRSERAHWALHGFVGACGLLMVASWLMVFVPGFPLFTGRQVGIPVKDYIAQSAEFTICVFLLAGLAQQLWRGGRPVAALLLSALAMMFLANILYVSTSRTALVVLPVLLVVFAATKFPWRGIAACLAAAVVVAALGWWSADSMRVNLTQLFEEVVHFNPEGDRTRAGERLAFWRKSVDFVSAAPAIGHGTGSIPQQFRRAAEGQKGMAGLQSVNPHNQILAVAIQLGLLGTAILLAMWLAHVVLFSGVSLIHWCGMVVVVQNLVGSLFNSHLFDFTHGWIYVVGVGIAGGAVLRRRSANAG